MLYNHFQFHQRHFEQSLTLLHLKPKIRNNFFTKIHTIDNKYAKIVEFIIYKNNLIFRVSVKTLLPVIAKANQNTFFEILSLHNHQVSHHHPNHIF